MQVTMNGAPIEFAGRLLRVTLDARDTQLLHGAATIKHGQLEVVLEDPEAADPKMEELRSPYCWRHKVQGERQRWCAQCMWGRNVGASGYNAAV